MIAATISDIQPYVNNDQEQLITLNMEGRESIFLIDTVDAEKLDRNQPIEFKRTDRMFFFELKQGEVHVNVEFYLAPNQKIKPLN